MGACDQLPCQRAGARPGDLAPAGGGYGGPTAFFIVQAIAILIERSPFGRRLGLGHGLAGWLFTAIALLAPAPFLFHDRFLTAIVIPFMEALGAA